MNNDSHMDASKWYDQGSRTKIDDLEVFYRHAGKGEALICLHGFPTSSWDFAPVWSALTSRFSVVAHDLIGLGKSAKPNRPLGVSLQADIVEALAVKLGIESAHILAHDLGDTVAQELLARQKENKSSIQWLSCVFLNGGIFAETHRPRLIQKLLQSPIGPLVAQLTTARTFQKNMINIFSKHYPPSKAFLEASWSLITENRGKAMIPKLIQYMAERSTNRTRWVQPLEHSTIPLRLINGALDPVSGKHAADRYREIVPNADVVLLEDVGHYPHVETPERVLEAFFNFHDNTRLKSN